MANEMVSDNTWKQAHIDTLRAICKTDDKYWYIGLPRLSLKQLHTLFQKDIGPSSNVFSLSFVISQIESNPERYFRSIDPPPAPLSENLTLGLPSEEPWDQSHVSNSLYWRDYENEALLILRAVPRETWRTIAATMNKLAIDCHWGDWDQRKKRVYTTRTVWDRYICHLRSRTSVYLKTYEELVAKSV